LAGGGIHVVGDGEIIVKRGVSEFKRPSIGVIWGRTPFYGDRSSSSWVLWDLKSESRNQRGDKGEEAKLAEHFRVVKSKYW